MAPESRANTTSVGAAVARGGPADWWLGAIDLLVRSSPSQGDNVADHIKEQLMERDRSACLSSSFPYDWNAGSRPCLMGAIIMAFSYQMHFLPASLGGVCCKPLSPQGPPVGCQACT